MIVYQRTNEQERECFFFTKSIAIYKKRLVFFFINFMFFCFCVYLKRGILFISLKGGLLKVGKSKKVRGNEQADTQTK